MFSLFIFHIDQKLWSRKGMIQFITRNIFPNCQFFKVFRGTNDVQFSFNMKNFEFKGIRPNFISCKLKLHSLDHKDSSRICGFISGFPFSGMGLGPFMTELGSGSIVSTAWLIVDADNPTKRPKANKFITKQIISLFLNELIGCFGFPSEHSKIAIENGARGIGRFWNLFIFCLNFMFLLCFLIYTKPLI